MRSRDDARARIGVADSCGRRWTTLPLGDRRTAVTLAASFACRLSRGACTFRALEVDRMGNLRRRIGSDSLRVLEKRAGL